MKNRPQRLISFLVVWLTMFSCISLKGQNSWKKTILAPDFKHLWVPGSNELVRANQSRLYGHGLSYSGLYWGIVQTRTMTADRIYLVPPDIYYFQSGYFCKREWELEKATHIPFRFRLGSLAECNSMEGKH